MKKLVIIYGLILVFSLIADESSSYIDIGNLIPPGIPYEDSTTRSVVVKGNYAYSLTREGSLYTYDISDIYNISESRTYTPMSDPLVVDVDSEVGGCGLMVYQGYIYLYGAQGITVISIDNPTSPTIINEVDVTKWIFKMIRAGDYLILCHSYYIGIYSLATPNYPSKVGDELWVQGGALLAAAVYGNYLYVGGIRGISDMGTLNVIDFSNPANPVLLDSYPLPDDPYHMQIVDNKLVISFTHFAQLWSLSTPSNPVLLDTIEFQGTYSNGRVCAQDRGNLLVNGEVYSVVDSSFKFLQFLSTQWFIQADGFPYGSDVVENEDQSYIFLAGDTRVSVLKSERGIDDNDRDGVYSDGDLSGIMGDNPCTGGNTELCDDNCPNIPNGPNLGICYSWTEVAVHCTTNSDCSPDGFCSINQEDTYPPQGNGIGDVCDCESDFDCDGDVDGTDATTFKLYFGRNLLFYPCDEINPCRGDFDCDQDCDGSDASLFKSDFGRSEFNNPCPACMVDEWCNYSIPPSTTTTMPITTTSTGPATTTTTEPTTTSTTIPPQCDLIISPTSETIYTWENIQFSTTLNGECNPPCNNWQVLSSIGSTIDSSGLYTAGDTAGSDTVMVTDNCNMNISDSAIVDVLFPTTSTTTIAP